MDKQKISYNILHIILTCTLPFVILIIFTGILLHSKISLFNSVLTFLSALLLTFYIYDKPLNKQQLLSNILLTLISCTIPILIITFATIIFFIEKNLDLMLISIISLFILFAICLITFFIWAIWTKGKIRKILFWFIFVIQMIFNLLLIMFPD